MFYGFLNSNESKRKKELEHYAESIESKIKDLAFYKKTLL